MLIPTAFEIFAWTLKIDVLKTFVFLQLFPCNFPRIKRWFKWPTCRSYPMWSSSLAKQMFGGLSQTLGSQVLEWIWHMAQVHKISNKIPWISSRMQGGRSLAAFCFSYLMHENIILVLWSLEWKWWFSGTYRSYVVCPIVEHTISNRRERFHCFISGPVYDWYCNVVSQTFSVSLLAYVRAGHL